MFLQDFATYVDLNFDSMWPVTQVRLEPAQKVREVLAFAPMCFG